VQPDNRTLERQILETLEEDSRVDPNEINVRVDNGVVYLEGTVDGAAERKAVREDVDSVPGVEQVVDNLKLVNFIERSDNELREAVRQDLIRSPYVDAAHVEVTARNGEVILEGVVGTFAEKSSAENVAWWTPGVTNVISQLKAEEADFVEDEPPW
jgi:osmotically-inducible protein OsmY